MSVCIPTTARWSPANRWDDSTQEELSMRDLAEVFAWRSLQSLTGYRLTICPLEVRPARASCRRGTYYIAPAESWGSFNPYIGADGLWRNEVHGGGCACNDATRVELPGPVARIDAVVIDGVQLDPSTYHLEDRVYLVRDDGQGWPLAQDMHMPVSEPGTFFVRLYIGEAPDETADVAAGILANEFLLGLNDDRACRLPSNVRLVSRQGVSYESVTSFFEDGLTGIQPVDAYVAWMNPHKLRAPSQAWSVDTINQVRIQGGAPSASSPAPIEAGSLVPDPNNPGYFRLEEGA